MSSLVLFSLVGQYPEERLILNEAHTLPYRTYVVGNGVLCAVPVTTPRGASHAAVPVPIGPPRNTRYTAVAVGAGSPRGATIG